MRQASSIQQLRKLLANKGAAGYIAESAGLNQSTVRRIASGEIARPSMQTMVAIDRGMKSYRRSAFCRASATLRDYKTRRRAA